MFMQIAFDPTAYGSIIGQFLKEPRLAPLGPGTPNRSVHATLSGLKLEEVFAPRCIADRDMANACLAGLWLYHDFLDESHTISQAIENATGSYWHGLMHRREPDFDNAKYWFRQVGKHPVFEPLRRAAANLAGRSDQTEWDPFGFVDLCGSVIDSGSSQEMLCRQMQQAEWELLFDYSFRQACGAIP